MRRLLTWLAGGVGGIALYRLATRRRAALAEPGAPEPKADPRADELRAKLEASRPLVDEPERFDAGERPVDEADPAWQPAARGSGPEDGENREGPEERRRRVHEEGRAAVEDMRRSSEPSA